jgi:hypothetical protein
MQRIPLNREAAAFPLGKSRSGSNSECLGTPTLWTRSRRALPTGSAALHTAPRHLRQPHEDRPVEQIAQHRLPVCGPGT